MNFTESSANGNGLRMSTSFNFGQHKSYRCGNTPRSMISRLTRGTFDNMGRMPQSKFNQWSNPLGPHPMFNLMTDGFINKPRDADYRREPQ